MQREIANDTIARCIHHHVIDYGVLCFEMVDTLIISIPHYIALKQACSSSPFSHINPNIKRSTLARKLSSKRTIETLLRKTRMQNASYTQRTLNYSFRRRCQHVYLNCNYAGRTRTADGNVDDRSSAVLTKASGGTRGRHLFVPPC